jgi:eukaryotic-like serine/threonine-protein kinase
VGSQEYFLTSDGRVKILDFGRARIRPVVPQEEFTDLPTESHATELGIVVGTFPYMSAEQVRGKSADARMDIFSFGCLLYEMISARRAFSSNTKPKY